MNAEEIKERVANLFGIEVNSDEFTEWAEMLNHCPNPKDDERYDELLDSGKFDDTEDPEYEAAWAVTNEKTDEELLASWKEYKKYWG